MADSDCSEPEGSCLWCGEKFIKSGKHHKCCSKTCQRKHHRKNYEWKRGPFTCEHCGKKYFTKRAAGQGERFCSRECAYTALARKTGPHCTVYFPTCTVCGKQFVARSILKTRCSDGCDKKHFGRLHFERNKAKKALNERACKECRTLFVPEYGDFRRAFCSIGCARKQGKRIGKAKRRAKIRGTVEYAAIDPMLVFNRDKWCCRICGKKTPQKKRGTIDPDAPELDHIIPLAAGGSHVWENVQCACRECNCAKGARPLGQIFLLGSMT